VHRLLDVPTGWNVTRRQLAALGVPPATRTFQPISYARLVDEVVEQAGQCGFEVTSSRFATARLGNQMFGLLTCASPGRDPALVLGLRHAYDHSLGTGLLVGHEVPTLRTCSFTDEAGLHRRQSPQAALDFEAIVRGLLGQVVALRERMERDIARMKARALSDMEAHHVVLTAVEQGIIPLRQVQPILGLRRDPPHAELCDDTAWSLFNVVSMVMKRRAPRVQMETTLALTRLFREAGLAGSVPRGTAR
jgi:hypothetical protein